MIRILEKIEADYPNDTRIAALIEYVRAAEGKMKADHDYKLGEISIYEFQAKLDIYLSARRKLGLEE